LHYKITIKLIKDILHLNFYNYIIATLYLPIARMTAKYLNYLNE